MGVTDELGVNLRLSFGNLTARGTAAVVDSCGLPRRQPAAWFCCCLCPICLSEYTDVIINKTRWLLYQATRMKASVALRFHSNTCRVSASSKYQRCRMIQVRQGLDIASFIQEHCNRSCCWWGSLPSVPGASCSMLLLTGYRNIR
jgi:hypothetical protein